MEFVLFGGFVAVIVSLFIWLVVYSIRSNTKATAQARAFAQGRNWSFQQKQNTIGANWKWGPFGESGRGEAQNVMWGSLDLPGTLGNPVSRRVQSFQYQVTDSTLIDDTSSTSTSYFHVVALELPRAFPELHLTPENILSRRFSRDIEFADPEFDPVWQVRGKDTDAIRSLLDVRIRRELLDPKHKGMRYTFIDGHLFVWKSGLQKLQNIDPSIELANQLTNLFPRG